MSDQYVFGSGNLYAMPLGGGVPLKFGVLQHVDVEFDGDLKELHGQYGFPVAVARGKQKIIIKAANGAINVALYNQLFFGESGVTTGSYSQSFNEAGTVPAVGPYTVTVANAARFYIDFGVTDANGTNYVQVPSAPGPYQYSVALGVYTFNAAQLSHKVVINYAYTSLTGSTLQLTNQLIGTQPNFQLVLAETFASDWLIMQFNSCVCSKLTLPLKLDDFMIADLEMSAQVDGTNSLGFISTSVA